MKQILFILMIPVFSLISCFDGINDAYNTKSGIDQSYYSVNIGRLKYVPAGSFQRNASSTDISVISTAFRMSEKEITRAQFTAVTGLSDPSDLSYSSSAADPVQRVNWYHALVFCNKLSIAEGLTPVYTIAGSTDPSVWIAATGGVIPIDGSIPANNIIWDAATANFNADGYRLPSEMEWMWASMGGYSDGRSGDIVGGSNNVGWSKGYAGSVESGTAIVNIGNYTWYEQNSGNGGGSTNPKIHNVGAKLPNEIGLYDMSGNVWEWCWDWHAGGPVAYDIAINGTIQVDYRGPSATTARVVRGGRFDDAAGLCAVAFRGSAGPYDVQYFIGFRVVRR